MENFKSFGKKLSVPFFPGFTAVTGPNGSGKSNIVDAILFVLGPKSSKVMRAGRLTDLIFNGGKKRKNPAKYCKVSLVFDNSSGKIPVDSNEVVLTRMIKRAPLKNDPNNYYSYFYINGKAASQSDFAEILTHARISGEGYNIVKQGDVTSLVEMGGIDRRRIIDDIAGISTFDNDIKKAEKEKDEAEGNLERIKIILNEISSQVKQLKNDRDAAFRYNELKERLYEIKAKIAYKKKDEVHAQIAEIQTQIDSYEKERAKFEEERAALKEKYTESQEKLEEIENKIADAGGDEGKEIKGKIEKLRTEEIKIEEKINYSNDEIVELKDEIESFQTELSGVESELTELETKKAELEQTLDEQQRSLEEKERSLDAARERIAQSDDKSHDLTHELTKMREEYNEKQVEIHELELQYDRVTENVDALESQLSELENTQSTYEFELKDIDWQLGELKKDAKAKTKEIKQVETQLFEKKKQEAEYTEQLTELETVIRKLQRDQSKLQAESEAAQAVQSKYNHAVDQVLHARDAGELKGIHGTIAELADVDSKFEVPVEIAAGARMQSVVVENDEAAAHAITFLRKRNLGRATFLPLNKMIVGKPRGKALLTVKDAASQGFAFDLVRFDAKYKGAFWYVFGDTVIVDTLSNARRLMGGVRLVDLQGNLIEASGAMIGGSKPKISLTFGTSDHGKLDEVSRKLHEAMTAQDTLVEQLASLRQEITELESSLATIKTAQDSDAQIKDLKVRHKEYSVKLESLLKNIEAKQEDKNALTEKQTTINNRIESVKQRVAELESLKEEKGKHLLQTSNKELAQNIRSLEEEVTTLQEKVLAVKADLEVLVTKSNLVEQRKSEFSEKRTKANAEIETYRDSIKDLKESRSRVQDELQALMTVEEQMTGKVKAFASTRDDIYKETVSIENELDKLNTRIESYQDLISRAKYRLPTLEEAVKELDQEIALYKVEITDKKLPNIESLKESMRVTQQSMEELEPVNMRALEEYEHQMERKKKFDEDVLHLQDQKKNLNKLVRNVTAKKTEQFFEVFTEINKNFQQIYAQLSEGGEASLQLEDEEHLFESGLTIRARPRGKKVLLLSALSGGEKSIASLAFIFAIQQYDPSPFYVLDEVDMFLDGINAETVSRMIKSNASHSQFITVSLRKILLNEANQVYGVTMHDSGISEMIGDIDPKVVGPKGELRSSDASVMQRSEEYHGRAA